MASSARTVSLNSGLGNQLSYYDFESDWPGFVRAWNSQAVVHAAELDTMFWRELGFFKNYKHGDPLWKQTKTAYWIGKNVEAARSISRRQAALYKRTMMAVCPRLASSDAYYKTCFGALIRDCEPAPGTIHSFIMPEATHIFRNAFIQCAREMFPDSTVGLSFLDGRSVVVLDGVTLFDLFGYYFDKYDKDVRYSLATCATS